MDSLAQELIDEIINHVPRRGTPATSLVARRWRRPSQQRHFEFVLFKSDYVTRWEANVPQDPDGIPSYVRHVRFKHFPLRLEPGILSRVLKVFTSMISLDIDGGRLPPPEELTVPVSLGEFGQCVTRLTLNAIIGEPSTVIVSFIFSFPNLRELVISNVPFLPDESPPIALDISQRGPLESLVVLGSMDLSYDYIPLWRFAPRRLSFGPSVRSGDLLVGVSSETMVELTLMDNLLSSKEKAPLRVIDLPSLPSLARIRVELNTFAFADSIAGLLCSIRSAPALSSVTFSFVGRWCVPLRFPSSGNWVAVDEWLVRMVATRAMAANIGLRVILAGWPENNQRWEGYFPGFRGAGGELRREIRDRERRDRRLISDAKAWMNGP